MAFSLHVLDRISDECNFWFYLPNYRLCSESADLRMSAGSLPKCWGFISLSGSVISPSDGVKIGRWPHENAKKSLKIRNPYPGLDQH